MIGLLLAGLLGQCCPFHYSSSFHRFRSLSFLGGGFASVGGTGGDLDLDPTNTIARTCTVAATLLVGCRRDKIMKTLCTPSSSDFPSFVTEDECDVVTIIGFGSLLSETSSRLTFPNLKNFRRGRVDNYRRVFGHPTSIFFRRGIANTVTKEMSSLAVEPAEGYGFVASVFEVSKADLLDGSQPGLAYLEREEEFDIVQVPFVDLDSRSEGTRSGIICARSTDEDFIRKWGQARFDDHYRKYGIESIWNWKRDSGLRPCAIYLRHCVLASKSLGQECYDSFLDDTYLVDRRTTVRTYLEMNPHILDLQPPADLVERYSG